MNRFNSFNKSHPNVDKFHVFFDPPPPLNLKSANVRVISARNTPNTWLVTILAVNLHTLIWYPRGRKPILARRPQIRTVVTSKPLNSEIRESESKANFCSSYSIKGAWNFQNLYKILAANKISRHCGGKKCTYSNIRMTNKILKKFLCEKMY